MNGFDFLEDYILRIPVEHSQKALQLLVVCDKWDLQGARDTITKELALKNLDKKCYPNAIMWALRHGNSALISAIVTETMENVDTKELLMVGNCLKCSGNLYFTCPELVFLRSYYEFLLYVSENKWESASDKLSVLLSNNSVPAFLYTPILDAMINCITYQDLDIASVAVGVSQAIEKLRSAITRSAIRVSNKKEILKKLSHLDYLLSDGLIFKDLMNA
ncbi:hypothetical protein L596_002809 [Steinernema carpocapsae]|uniref:Nuclear pore complex protein Nup85 n=1 Tax=Steinernema carpocapsae TaxID=34508 RepID=A0A4U8UT90_STECR|nr:hypothetical protein L596_002809 [Steinernema carpocapsae]